MDPSKFAGMPWDVWAQHIEIQTKEIEEPNVCAESQGANKLQREDMKMFGLYVDSEPLELVTCEVCDMVIKSQALVHHFETRHSEFLDKGISHEGSSLEVTEREGSPLIATPSVGPSSAILSAVDYDFESMNDDISENTLIRSLSTRLTPQRRLKRLKRSETKRSPLGQMCTNKFHVRTKEQIWRNKHKQRRTALEKTNDGMNSLLRQLPEMSLNSMKEEEISDCTAGEVPCSDPVSYISRPPRALSASPLFSCHKVGGLFYPGRNMKLTRQGLEHSIEEGINIPTHSIQQRRTRRRKTASRLMKENDKTTFKFK